MAAAVEKIELTLDELTTLHLWDELPGSIDLTKIKCSHKLAKKNLANKLSIFEFRILSANSYDEIKNLLSSIIEQGPQYDMSPHGQLRIVICVNLVKHLPKFIRDNYLQRIGLVDCNDEKKTYELIKKIIEQVLLCDFCKDNCSQYFYKLLEAIELIFNDIMPLKTMLEWYESAALGGNKEALQKIKWGLSNSKGESAQIGWETRLFYFRMPVDIEGLNKISQQHPFADLHLALVKKDENKLIDLIKQHPDILRLYKFKERFFFTELMEDLPILLSAINQINSSDNLGFELEDELSKYIKHWFMALYVRVMKERSSFYRLYQVLVTLNNLYIEHFKPHDEDMLIRLINGYSFLYENLYSSPDVTACLETMIATILDILPSAYVMQLLSKELEKGSENKLALVVFNFMINYIYVNNCVDAQDKPLKLLLSSSDFKPQQDKAKLALQKNQLWALVTQYSLAKSPGAAKPKYTLETIRALLKPIAENLVITFTLTPKKSPPQAKHLMTTLFKTTPPKAATPIPEQGGLSKKQ